MDESSQQAISVADVLAQLREQVRERRARLSVDDANNPHALNLAELRRSAWQGPQAQRP